ncbi:PIN/TRAM domain-containing protein [Shouchella sp. JSM 1781072]|uniref:PIN/TRAM domain-containing protein n=1 Tax=Bacillaceae TaxID=186817 RepID=UPI000C0799AE|nr:MULTISPECIES: PIN/TRAM domain-containing protein [Bacillaceae]UTR06587.1 PIN/TRAM domain-containing protein [Alkalihalobacillus sp. LMS6]
MLKWIIQIFFILAGATLGVLFVPELIDATGYDVPAWLDTPYTGATIGALLFFIVSLFIARYIVNFFKMVEETIVKAPIADVLTGSIGLIVGLIVGYLAGTPLNLFDLPVISNILPSFITILVGYLGFQIGFKKRDEMVQFIQSFRTPKERDGQKKKDENDENEKRGQQLKILDTSVIIDGRIADICQTNFLEGTLVIPQFVLDELQYIADSSDALKRNRGRRGLDILNRIQKELPIDVEIYEGDFEEIQEVDSKLVKLAKVTSGVVVTNDFNLNKVCELQGVQVLNINDLANAVKPVVLPGEVLSVHVIKEGKENHQGVAYLDDGTMIVVEGGRDWINKHTDVTVTSVLQTSAGRMIFAKPKSLEKAQ